MSDNTFRIVELVVKLVFALLATYVVPYVVKWLKDKKMYATIKDAVQSVQQTDWSRTGAARKKKALSLIRPVLDKWHIDITDEQLSALVESAVKELRISEGVTYNK